MSKEEYQKMDPKVKRRWVKALRSGKYKQTQRVLRDFEGGHCCVGVLCDLVEPDGWNGAKHHHGFVTAGGGPVTQGVGLSEAAVSHLIKFNDAKPGHGRKTFRGIATWIEKNL